MYSEPAVEVNMDYPVRVATKLKFASRWRVVGAIAEAKVWNPCESLASRRRVVGAVAEAKVWNPLRVAGESGPTRNKIRRC